MYAASFFGSIPALTTQDKSYVEASGSTIPPLLKVVEQTGTTAIHYIDYHAPEEDVTRTAMNTSEDAPMPKESSMVIPRDRLIPGAPSTGPKKSAAGSVGESVWEDDYAPIEDEYIHEDYEQFTLAIRV